ncbi:MAG: hypothetical protein RI554_05425 [Trueperaceae bacterium]|nr:hypothetical protein [Trueperaceae bacterium]
MRRPPTAGLTLLETLVAAAAFAVFTLLLAPLATAAVRFGGGVADDVAAATRARLAADLVRSELRLAGRAVPGDGLELHRAFGPGGDALRIRYTADRARVETKDVHRDLYAARDGRGRWTLYVRPVGGRARPWLLGVERLHVAAVRTADGVLRTRDDGPWRAVRAVRVDLAFVDAPPTSVWVAWGRSVDLRPSP